MDQTVTSATFQFPVPPTIFSEFPNVPTHIIEGIAKNEFKPVHLAQLRPQTSAYDQDASTLPKNDNLDRFPDYDSLIQPLLVYFNILSALAANTGDVYLLRALAEGSYVYLGWLREHGQCDCWEELLENHLRFHEERCLEMSRGDFTTWKISKLAVPGPSSSRNKSLPSPWQSAFPPEVLEIVFNHAVIPNFLLDPSFIAGPNSAWCKNIRTQKSLLLVCKTWYASGIRYLYENVYLRRTPQLFSFSDTLAPQSSTMELRNIVKTFNISGFVEAEDAHIFQQRIIEVLGLCPNLTRFGFSSTFEKLPISSALHHLRPSITQLCLDSPTQIDYPMLSSMLRHLASRLTFLLICPHRIVGNEINAGSAVSLPDLETLICHIDKDELSRQLLVMTASWSMPKLQKLSLCLADYRGLGSASGLHAAAILPFFAKHGSRLKFLDVTAYIARVFGSSAWEGFFQKMCPLLEHLVVDEDCLPLKDTLLSSRLKWLYLRQSTSYVTAIDSETTVEQEMDHWQIPFPHLLHYRRLWDLPIYLAEWLQTFPPAAGSNHSEKFVVDTYDGRLVHGAAEADIFLELDQDGYETESDDEEYAPSSESGKGSTSPSSAEYRSNESESSRDWCEEVALELAMQNH